MMAERFEPQIVGFLCNWCSYAGADLAGTSRLSYPANIRIVRVPCSGRVDPLFVARALKEGADGVLVLGCHPGDCHYSDGNYYARRRFAVMQELLFFLGYERGRVRLDWVSASEGAKFARVVTEFTEQVRQLGPWAPSAHIDFDATPTEAWRTPPSGTRPAPGTSPGDLTALTAQLRQLATGLLAEGRVDQVLGWESGSVRVRPLFARTAEQAQRLVVDPTAGLNIVTYLRTQPGRCTAVVVRPAEARALNLLLTEGQVRRDDLFLIGLGTDVPANAQGIAYDAVLGTPAAALYPAASPLLDEMERWPVSQRASFWQAQFTHCLRCYACRQACPLCYCGECVSEQLDPAWQSIAIETQEKAFFHTMRAFHLAGRCVGCEACTAACPVGIPLFLLNQKVAREVARLFDGYVAGIDADVPLPFTTFRKEETLVLAEKATAVKGGRA
jgi:coenzyme F420-reducing hydrogenase delta subunit/ferredoxin